MMNSWQEWVVALLLLLCAVRIGMSIYSFFHTNSLVHSHLHSYHTDYHFL